MTSTTSSTSSSTSSTASTDTNVTANSTATISSGTDRVERLQRDVLVDLAGQRGVVVAAAAAEAQQDDRQQHDDERRPTPRAASSEAVPDPLDVVGLLGERRRKAGDHHVADLHRGSSLLVVVGSVVAAGGIADDAARTLGPLRPAPPAERAAQGPGDEVGDRRADHGGDLEERRDVADRDVERAGDDVL